MRKLALGTTLALAMVLVVAAAALVLLRAGRVPASGLELTYACPEAVAEDDARAVGARIDDLGLFAGVEATDATHLRLRVDGDPSSVAAARALVEPHALELRAVDEAAMHALASSTLPPGVRAQDGVLLELEASDAAAFAGMPVPSGRSLVSGCPTPGVCHAYVVGPVELDASDVEHARASSDGVGPRIDVSLGATGGDRLARLTGRSIGARIAIVIDGHVVMAPVVREAIRGGAIAITLGDGAAPGEADAIARALRGGQLACSRWSLEREAAFGPGAR